jgi:hypothetical protein
MQFGLGQYQGQAPFASGIPQRIESSLMQPINIGQFNAARFNNRLGHNRFGLELMPAAPDWQSTPPNHPHPVPSGLTLPSGNLIDPITAKERNVHHVPVDKILDYSTLDHIAHNLKTIFYTLPKTVFKGLRGDPDFTFSDFMLVSQIPYYAGGAFLAYSFLAGRDKPSFARQGVGVGLYYLGNLAANGLINKIYKYRYGVDLTQKYKRADGRIEKVFASADFARFDLLTKKQYAEMQRKMKIPSHVADSDQACREQLYGVISSSRAIKLLLGNALAAVGAGYIARSIHWSKLLGSKLLGSEPILSRIWRDPLGGSFFNRLATSWTAFKSNIMPALEERILGIGPSAPSATLRKSVLGGLLLVGAFCLYNSWNVIKPKRYESSPYTLLPRGENWLNDQSVFKRFQLMQDMGRSR